MPARTGMGGKGIRNTGESKTKGSGMFRSAIRLLWILITVVAASTGCSSLDTISDPVSSVSLGVGEKLQLGAHGDLVISLVGVDRTSKTARFNIHDSVEATSGALVEFEGDCREGDLLKMSPDLSRGYCRLTAVRESSVCLTILGGTSEDIWIQR